MILNKIINDKKQEVAHKKSILSEFNLRKFIEKEEKNIFLETKRSFKKALEEKDFAIIGEIKRASPSKGIIKEDFNVVEIAKLYEVLPIDAISVLTEGKYFKGSDDYVKFAKMFTTKSILRKDFIVDIYQLYESRYIGADAVLLITSVLGDEFPKFYKLTRELGLDALVEVHNEHELDIALKCDAEIIGINNRDLNTFKVNLKTTERLMKNVDSKRLIISESGVKDREDIEHLKSLKVKGALIGESLMRNINNKNNILKII